MSGSMRLRSPESLRYRCYVRPRPFGRRRWWRLLRRYRAGVRHPSGSVRPRQLLCLHARARRFKHCVQVGAAAGVAKRGERDDNRCNDDRDRNITMPAGRVESTSTGRPAADVAECSVVLELRTHHALTTPQRRLGLHGQAGARRRIAVFRTLKRAVKPRGMLAPRHRCCASVNRRGTPPSAARF